MALWVWSDPLPPSPHSFKYWGWIDICNAVKPAIKDKVDQYFIANSYKIFVYLACLYFSTIDCCGDFLAPQKVLCKLIKQALMSLTSYPDLLAMFSSHAA